MNAIKIPKIFLIISTISIFILLSSCAFAAYDISPEMQEEFLRISKNATMLYIIRTMLLVFSILFIIIVVANLDRLGEVKKLKIILVIAIFGLLTNFFIGRMYLTEDTIKNLYADYTTNDFCYLYRGELLTFRFEENEQNVILVCQKNRLETGRINKTIKSILTVLLKNYNLPPTLYYNLIETTTSSDYITFERNPEKTDFEKTILDDSYKFVRITFNDNVLSSLNPSGTVK